MEENSIQAISYKKFRLKPKVSNESVEENLIKILKQMCLNQIQGTDITYKKRQIHLSLIMDLYSCKIIAHR